MPGGPSRFAITTVPPDTKLNKLVTRATLQKYGSIRSITSLPNQTTIVFNSIENAEQLTQLKAIGNVAVKITESPRSRGTVFCYDLAELDDSELRLQLGSSATLIRRLATRGTPNASRSGRLLLEFATNAIPSEVILECGVKLDVRQHIPLPLRCRKCKEYNSHHESNCPQSTAICGNCSGRGHEESTCTAPPHCPACGGAHPITSTDCPKWKKELSVNKIRFNSDVSTAEARTIWKTQQPVKKSTQAAPPMNYNKDFPPAPNSKATTTTPARTYAAAVAESAQPAPPPTSLGNDIVPALLRVIDRLDQQMEKQSIIMEQLLVQNQCILTALQSLIAEPNNQKRTRVPDTPSPVQQPVKKKSQRQLPATPSSSNQQLITKFATPTLADPPKNATASLLPTWDQDMTHSPALPCADQLKQTMPPSTS